MIVVIAPHPDDDVLGCGAFLAGAARRGARVQAVYVTDGAGSHTGSRAFPPERLRAVRAGEARAALACLGIVHAPLFLDVPDGAVPCDGAAASALVARLATGVPDRDGVLVLGPWRRDPHPDHRATALAVQRLARLRPRARFVEYAVWLGERGTADDRVRKGEGRVVQWPTHGFMAAKRDAIEAHASQLGRVVHDARTAFVLPATLIARALGPAERFVVAA